MISSHVTQEMLKSNVKVCDWCDQRSRHVLHIGWKLLSRWVATAQKTMVLVSCCIAASWRVLVQAKSSQGAKSKWVSAVLSRKTRLGAHDICAEECVAWLSNVSLDWTMCCLTEQRQWRCKERDERPWLRKGGPSMQLRNHRRWKWREAPQQQTSHFHLYLTSGRNGACWSSCEVVQEGLRVARWKIDAAGGVSCHRQEKLQGKAEASFQHRGSSSCKFC